MPMIELESIIENEVKEHSCSCGKNPPGKSDHKLIKTKLLEILDDTLRCNVILKCSDCKRDHPFYIELRGVIINAND